MEQKLLDLKCHQLLEKFGAGEHKPGSGSAAALNGMTACQLLITVIELTTAKKRKPTYGKHWEELNNVRQEISSRIYPELTDLFQRDSDEFDQAIILRKQRDEETMPMERAVLANKAIEALRISTETPIEIASLCLEVCRYAVIVFDKGFKSARGDSSVALNSALSAVGGCISIIDLNLTSFQPNDWFVKICNSRDSLKEDFNALSKELSVRHAGLKSELGAKLSYHTKVSELLRNIEDSFLPFNEIEFTVRKLQNAVWNHRESIWKKNTPENYLEILDPKKVLKSVGYAYSEAPALGSMDEEGIAFEVAGIIDKPRQTVQISDNFPREVKRFTTAHELGHAILHRQEIYHRGPTN